MFTEVDDAHSYLKNDPTFYSNMFNNQNKQFVIDLKQADTPNLPIEQNVSTE